MTSDGFFCFYIDAVARQADVARMTVYHQFGSKIGLRHALETGASRQAKEHIPPSLYVSTAALESRKLCKTLGILTFPRIVREGALF